MTITVFLRWIPHPSFSHAPVSAACLASVSKGKGKAGLSRIVFAAHVMDLLHVIRLSRQHLACQLLV